MTVVTYQTVRLEKGRHSSPEDGACVMELASMLAGEPFSDHPGSVSSPIAGFLRGYNDVVDDDRRQDLFGYAARVVGTRSTPWIEQSRAERLVRWADELKRSRRWRIFGPFRRGQALTVDYETASGYAVQAIRRSSEETHRRVLALVDELIVMGSNSRNCDVLATEVGTPSAPLLQPSGVI